MKQARRAPIYQSCGKCYEIDACLPQIEALRSGCIEMRAISKGHYPGKFMKSNLLPGVSSAGFWDSRRSQDWGLDDHRNEGVEIVFLETGEEEFAVDGKRYELRAGDLTVTRPWQLHRLGDPHIGRGRLHWLILDVGVRRPNQQWSWPEWVILQPQELAVLSRRLRLGKTSVWRRTDDEIRKIFREMASCVTDWEDAREASRLAITINRLLLALLEMPADFSSEDGEETESQHRTVELFLRDLAESPGSAEEQWTLESMAAHCGMGTTALSRYCRKIVNNGPVAYLNLCRLDHADRLLRSRSDLSVTEIALLCGFNSSQYFATSFRKRFKMTPSDLRRS